MQVRAKTTFATAFGTFREGELITVSQQEAVGFLNAGLAELAENEPSTATVPGKNVERAVRIGRRTSVMNRFREFIAIGLAVTLAFVGFSSPGHAQITAQSDSTYLNPVYFSRTGVLVAKAAAGPGLLSDNGSIVYNARFRTAIADVNTGVTLLPAIAGYKYRIIDMAMISIGGATATCTTVDVLATQSTASVKLLAVAVAALTQSALVRAGASNATILADGVSFVKNDVNTAVTIGKTGSSCATATNVDLILTYAIEA